MPNPTGINQYTRGGAHQQARDRTAKLIKAGRVVAKNSTPAQIGSILIALAGKGNPGHENRKVMRGMTSIMRVRSKK